MPIKVEGITLSHVHAGELLPQGGDQIVILLDGNHPPRSAKQGARESAWPGTDLQHGVLRTGLQRIRDAPQESGIREKVLSQPAFGMRHG
jgi:hypothetical protein